MITLKNESLEISIHPSGAELQSIRSRKSGMEYMWSGDPAFWGKYAPILFPIVGTLKNNTYQYNGRSYTLPRHGFARERTFELTHQSDHECCCTLESDEQTLAVYPFCFTLNIRYALKGNSLSVSYEVINRGDEKMLFSIGAHPAFALPLEPMLTYEDYYLEFNKNETVARWALKDGLLDQPVALLKEENKIPLKKKLFHKDALVLKGLTSSSIAIRTDRSLHGLKMHFAGFPFFGIWAAKDAPFVCLEPWHGIADSVDHDGELEGKEGIIALDAKGVWEAGWELDVF